MQSGLVLLAVVLCLQLAIGSCFVVGDDASFSSSSSGGHVVRFPLTSHLVTESATPEEQEAHARLTRRATAAFTVVPLLGLTTIVFSAEMAFGTPPQNLSCVVDTGSSNLAVAASRLAGAPQYFNTSASTTYQDQGDSFSTNYLSGSWTGERSSDLVKFAATSDAPIRADFAAITESDNFFRDPARLGVFGQYAFDGILGMGFPALANPSDNPVTPFFDTYIANFNVTNAFTVQLCDFQINSGSLAVRPGNLVVGGVESDVASLAVGAFHYVTIVEQQFYEVTMTGISVGGQRLSNTCDMYNSPNNAFLDSGTTNIIVPQSVFNQIRASMTAINNALSSSDQELFYNGGNTCITIPQSAMTSLPDITIHIAAETAGSEHNFVVRPWQYLRVINTTSDPNVVCRAWGFSPSCNTILGTVFMDGYTVFHDRTNMRIGIATSTCGVQAPFASAPAITTTALPSGFDVSTCKPSSVCNSAAQLVPAVSALALALLSIISAVILL